MNVKVMAGLEFELASYNVADQQVSPYGTGATHYSKLVQCFYYAKRLLSHHIYIYIYINLQPALNRINFQTSANVLKYL